MFQLASTSFRYVIDLDPFPTPASSESIQVLRVYLVTVNRVPSSTWRRPTSSLLLNFLHLLVMKIEKSNFLLGRQVHSIRQINN